MNMLKIFSIVIFLQTLFSFSKLKAGDGIVENSLKMYVSSNQNIRINEVSSKPYLSKFCAAEKCLFDAHYAHHYYWIYCEIENEQKIPYVFDSHFFYYDVTAYYFTENMTFIDSVSTGYNIKVKDKIINTSSNALTVPITRKLKCFIRFKTTMPAGIHFELLSLRDLTNIKLKEHTFYGVINGIFFLAILYSVLFALLLWKRIYVYYMLYVSFFWIFMLSVNHDTPLYLSWLIIPYGHAYYIVPHFLFTIFLILYTHDLLRLKSTLNLFSKINMTVISILILLLGLYLTTGWSWRDDYLNKIALLPSFIASIILIKRKYKTGWFVFVGISLIYFAFLSIKFDLARFLPRFYIFSVYGIIEIVLFGISISFWIKSLSSEKEKALVSSLAASEELATIKQNQNILLEKEVNAKTIELKLANHQLEQSYQEIEELNKYLENDNDRLKVRVSDQLKARSEDKLMSFEEFKLNFPDDNTCYKHIENIKWPNGFICIKCRSTSYYEKKISNNKPARKCTKCGFINTISAYTLFHNLKFPIQKAFYITYVIGTKKTKTLEDFSSELDIRSATVHAFVQKVKEASNAVTKKKHKDGWTHLIEYHKPSA